MSRKRKKANEAVPEEILAEGSGPTQDVESLAEAANEAFAADASGSDDDVVFDATPETPRRKRGRRAEVMSDEPVVEPVIEQDEPRQAEAVEPDAPRRKRGRKGKPADTVEAVETLASDEASMIEAAVLEAAVLEEEEAAVELEDSEVGPELEEAEVAAEQVAQADEQVLAEAVMRAEAEAELGAAEPEAEAGEEDIELNAALPTTAATMDDQQLKHLVEALIFAADKPVTLQRLRQLTRISDVKRLEAALAALAVDFADRGIALQQVSGGYQFRTNTQFSTWVQQLIAGRPVRLSRAQLETLAIVAYRQPITRPEVDEIRGVDSSATLRLLMDRSLIRILGKKEDVGRPILYGTTKEFLDFFSLGDLRELPTLREYSELTAESRKVMSDRLGIGMDAAGGEGVETDDAAELADDEASVVVGQDATVDDLVREFAQDDLGAEDVAGLEAAIEAAAVEAASEESADPVEAASDEVVEMAASEPHPVEASGVAADAAGDEELDAETALSLEASSEVPVEPSSDQVEAATAMASSAESVDVSSEAPGELSNEETGEASSDAIETSSAESVDVSSEVPGEASSESTEMSSALVEPSSAEVADAAAADAAQALADEVAPAGADAAPADDGAAADDVGGVDAGDTVSADVLRMTGASGSADAAEETRAAADPDVVDAGESTMPSDDVSAPDSLDSTDEPPTD